MIRWTLIGVSLVLALSAGTAWAVTSRGPQYAWGWPSNRNMSSETAWSVAVRDGGIQVHRGLAFLGSGPGWPVERSEVAGFQYARVFVIVPL